MKFYTEGWKYFRKFYWNCFHC